MKVLRSRLLDLELQEQESKISQERRSMVGSGDRSEKIRTYNFPQGRVTDHRIGLTLYRLESILQGDLDMILDPLNTHFQAEALKGNS
jgi:peptide chain release factor 1